jgi:hypothetical protein
MTAINRTSSVALLFGLALATTTNAQVTTINSAVIQSRAFNDIPGATYTGVNTYPGSISLSEQHVSAPSGFANRDVWQFSNNGTTAYGFQHNDYFHAQFSLNLTGTPISPRKEAGFLFNTGTDGELYFIVNTDGHEVVQFGGVSFWSFNANNGISYNSGDTITLGMTYFLDGNGKNALVFSANGVSSPVFEFGPGIGGGALGIDDGSTLGGYFQIQNDPNNPNNGGTAVFSNISVVPEPSALALLGLGIAPLFLRRRR